MRAAPHLLNEDARLVALAAYDIQPGVEDAALTRIVGLAARMFSTPVALISLVGRDTQQFAARIGVDACSAPRDTSFCGHVIAQDDIMVVNDATLDVRFADNPNVMDGLRVRFYAGVPLRSPDGFALGTLCVNDHRPRNGMSDADRENLRTLGALVTDRLETRRAVTAGAVEQSRFQSIAATSPDGIVCADDMGRITFWNAGCERVFGFSAEEAIGRQIDLIVPARMRGGHDGGLRRAALGGPTFMVGTTVELDAEHKDGTEFPIELSLSMWREGTQASFGAIIRDIRERRANETRLFNMAHLDGLTALPNRAVMLTRIGECMAANEPLAVLMLDLDGFKNVNDTLGHTAGDVVLREVARRVLECIRPIDTVARLGGDEFAIMIPGAGSARGTVGAVADQMIAAIGAPYVIDGQVIHIGASIGIASAPDDGDHAEDLLSAADLAMYHAKGEGRNCRRFFTPPLRDAVVHRRAFEGELRRAIDQGEFELFYQPQVRISDGVLLGVEALLRWRHPEQGLLEPARFLSTIENGLLAPDVGRWVLETACNHAVALRARMPALVMGVNLFGAQFRTGRLAEDVIGVLARTGLPPTALELEITENIALRHDETMLPPLKVLRELGVGVAFDDFGTGFASLSLLKRYPLTRLKIDRSFIREIGTDRSDTAVVSAMVFLSRGLGIEVIAEGVETEEQRDLLRACGCDVVQGYLYGKPMALSDLHDFIGMQLRMVA
ncbi:putative bifunctional diguanylate cyclase/phosphodiesterase [Sphingomonas prati]|uniref:Diguanylate cyclase (GGDEF)-like protein/PAS domain S-box-containing protein n=1 Tax=Sphingomonas prati TaxID=1843237 RepID=A0A7W9BRT4_9SPHN|nr:EAL domain-containing protein [Sphingomonas prati]MBB5728922.1 diguanylate cyclase (GGDEF)-like protein/PAS domain S-box-containing protein [Sphingomonas prati]GGE86509.1 bifunctional diguanylate cyclase/phosphodiesterase [Sphingomonas prati]